MVLLGIAVASSLVLSGQVVRSPLYEIQPTVLSFTTQEGLTGEFSVAVVTKGEDQRRGLMYVRYLPIDRGMLFLYPTDRTVGIWMKNTNVPLDIWFITKDGLVAQIERNAVPGSERTIRSAQPVRAVLEINGGLTDIVGAGVGTKVSHSSLGDSID